MDLLFAVAPPPTASAEATDEQQIRAMTEGFCQKMVDGDLSILDEMFDLSPGNVFDDINEGPLTPEHYHASVTPPRRRSGPPR